MAFDEETVKQAFQRAKGRCESCGVALQWSKRGNQWEAHHKHSVDAGGGDSLSNCKILCIDCHRTTL